jgi:hypothetical protein
MWAAYRKDRDRFGSQGRYSMRDLRRQNQPFDPDQQDSHRRDGGKLCPRWGSVNEWFKFGGGVTAAQVSLSA